MEAMRNRVAAKSRSGSIGIDGEPVANPAFDGSLTLYSASAKASDEQFHCEQENNN